MLLTDRMRVVDRITTEAAFSRILDRTLLGCLKTGRKIPEYLLPGRLIQSLSPEERAVLADATGMDFRPGWLYNAYAAHAACLRCGREIESSAGSCTGCGPQHLWR